MPTQGQIVAAILDAGRQAAFTGSTFYGQVATAIAANDPDALSRVIVLAFASGLLTQPDVDAIMVLIPGSPN
jgi:hypothetical protein